MNNGVESDGTLDSPKNASSIFRWSDAGDQKGMVGNQREGPISEGSCDFEADDVADRA